MPTPTTLFIEGGSGQSTRLGVLFGSRISGRLYDEMGAWMPGEQVEFVLPAAVAVPSGTFPGGVPTFTATTDAEGRAQSEFIQADNLLGTWVGTVASVSNPAVRADFYLNNVVTPFTPSQVQITANGTQKAAQFTSYQPVTARLTDGVGNGVSAATITMTCDTTFGSFSGGGNSRNVTTDASGYGTFPAFNANGKLGNFTPAVSYPALAQAFAHFTTIDPAVPTALQAYAGNNQHTPPNFLFPQQLVARVTNAIGNPVAGISVTFDAPNSGASAVWASPFTDPVTRTSDASGLATSPSLSANATAGTYNVTATSPAIPVLFFQLTNGGASPVPDTSTLLISEA